MEYQGIITGIGNENTNLITPEIDAVINNFIIGNNTIIKGFDKTYNMLTSGTCVLCGYCGIMDKNIDVENLDNYYIYGKFILNFDKEQVDEFYIIFQENELISENLNPQDITQKGTYYITIWDKVKGVTKSSYPRYSHYSKYTNTVKKYIDDNAQGVTHSVNDNSTKIATTEYVHNQIEEEIDYEIANINISEDNENYILTFEKKANYVIISYNITIKQGKPIKENFNIPEKFVPQSNRETIIYIRSSVNNYYYVYKLTLQSDGVATITGTSTTTDPSFTTLSTGYKI